MSELLSGLSIVFTMTKLPVYVDIKTNMNVCNEYVSLRYINTTYMIGNCTASKISSIGSNLNASWSSNGHYISVGNKVRGSHMMSIVVVSSDYLL